MTEKIKAIRDKYNTTKALSTIKNYFNNIDTQVWTDLNQYIKKEYLVIPNLSTWVEDFSLGNTEKVYITPLLFEPFTYDVNLRNGFNMYGNTAYGDIISLLRSCNDYGMKKLEVMDFGTAILLIAAMAVHTTYTVDNRYSQRKVNLNIEVSKKVDWLVRSTVSALTLPEDISNTKYILHIPNMYNCLSVANSFIERMKPHMKTLKSNLGVYPTNYQGLTNGAYLMYVSGFDTKIGFTKPEFVFHEMQVTRAENAILHYSDKFQTNDPIEELRKIGVDKAYECIKDSLTPVEQVKLLNILQSEEHDNSMYYLPDVFTQRVHQVLHTRKRKTYGITLTAENVCTTLDKQLQQPVATCIIDVDKIILDNSTKSKEWIVNTIAGIYSSAQDINRLRYNLQTHPHNDTLLVLLKLSKENSNLTESVTNIVENINNTLISIYDERITYKIVEVI